MNAAKRRRFISLVLCVCSFSTAVAQDFLPPAIPWHGKSYELVVPKGDPWITPCEASDFRLSPSYDDTIAWLKKLADAAPQTLKMVSLGKSPEGRDIWMMIASREGASTPQELKA